MKKGNDANSDQSISTNINDLEVVVFVLDKENKVHKKKVKTGIQDINYIEIKEGLTENEEVISGPYDVVSKELKEGKQVKKVDKKELFEKKKDD